MKGRRPQTARAAGRVGLEKIFSGPARHGPMVKRAMPARHGPFDTSRSRGGSVVMGLGGR